MPTLGQQPQILFADSGIQFIDYHFSIDSCAPSTPFIRASVQGPLCEVIHDENGHYAYYANDGDAVEWVRPEYFFSIEESLERLEHHWLPIPYLTVGGDNEPLGPTNWARVYLARPAQPEQDWSITLAFDTAVSLDNGRLQPSQFEVEQGQIFAFPDSPKIWQRYLQQAWVSEWMETLFPASTLSGAVRPPSYLWQAHYLNLLKVLTSRVLPPPLLIRQLLPHAKAIGVDAIIDLGNSNSCGVLYEAEPNRHQPLSVCSEVRIRDLSCPTEGSSTLFSSELNFAPAPFGIKELSSASGRIDAFQWHSLVRMGPEAQRLNRQSHQDLQYQGITCPRRYLWDEHASPVIWFNATQTQQAQYSSIDHPMSLLLNDQGNLLEALPAKARFPVFIPQFSRSTLFTFLITELISQIAVQINSLSYRQRQNSTERPRYLRHIMFTLPVNFTALEREQFSMLAQRAIDLVKAVQPAFFPISFSAIHISFPWDETCCGQIFWLWQTLRNQSISSLLQRYHRSDNPHLRMALIDVGGGTTDLAVTDYPLSSPDNLRLAALMPQLQLRQGFTLAGDSLLEDIISHFLLPQMAQFLQAQGVTSVEVVLERLFSREKSDEGDTVWRQYVVRHLLLPVVEDIFSRYRLDETDYFCRVSQMIEPDTFEYLESSLAEKITRLSTQISRMNLRELCFEFRFNQFVAFLGSEQCRLTKLLALISDTVTDKGCDVVLLSGQVMELPVFQQIFRQHAAYCCLLTELSTDAALPFCATGRLANGKYATSLGGLLYKLMTERLIAEQPILPGDISNIPVKRWYGPLSDTGRLQTVLVSPEMEVIPNTRLTVTQPISIGYRCSEAAEVVASPLFAIIPHPNIVNLAAGITVELEWHFDAQGELMALPTVISVEDRQQQCLDRQCVTIEMNTLSLRGDRQEYYWRDDGRVMAPIT